MHFHMTKLPRLISSCFNSNRSCMATDLNDDNCMFWFQWSTDVQMALLGVTLKMDTATPPTMARTMSVTVRMATFSSLRMVWMAIPSPELKTAWHRVMSTTWTTPVSVSVTESYDYDTWTTLVSISWPVLSTTWITPESIGVNIVIYITSTVYIFTAHGNVIWTKVTLMDVIPAYVMPVKSHQWMSLQKNWPTTHSQLLHINTHISLNIYL